MKAAGSRPPAQPPGSITPIPAANPRKCDQQPHLGVVEITGTSPDGIEAATPNCPAAAAEATRGLARPHSVRLPNPSGRFGALTGLLQKYVLGAVHAVVVVWSGWFAS